MKTIKKSDLWCFNMLERMILVLNAKCNIKLKTNGLKGFRSISLKNPKIVKEYQSLEGFSFRCFKVFLV
jgi:hypothetical protein